MGRDIFFVFVFSFLGVERVSDPNNANAKEEEEEEEEE